MKSKILSSCRFPLLFALGVVLLGVRAWPANVKGSGGDMPAYYDASLFTINFAELPAGGEQAVHNHNSQINIIYQCDSCPFEFISVIDAIQADGFNPIWEEWQINFNEGHTPHQFFSDNEVLAAVAAGEITLTDTDEMYRCSVVGPKKT